jgi:O-acetyl-ADP-ribose deacetylase (regulator of RNase III)
MTLLDLALGDLATARADAIATSANVDLQISAGVNAAIHAAAGPELAQYCSDIGELPVGQPTTTLAGRLQARYVIHGVAPRWKDGRHGETTLLATLYKAVV